MAWAERERELGKLSLREIFVISRTVYVNVPTYGNPANVNACLGVQ